MKKIFFAILVYSNISLGQETNKNCIYDSSLITDEFISKISVNKYVWSDLSKEAKIITKEGDFFYIRKWACETEGLVARLFVVGDYKEVDKDFLKWKNKVLSQGKEILDEKNYLELQNYFLDDKLTAKRFGTDLVFDINSDSMKKFIIVISPLDKLVIINYLIYK
ncbi:hypothetical protein BWK59_14255 [Flavobacterium davisii]|uniref:Uncharacterized protein n=1 Tax=Flavobacterium davisii TaxID=2906077 RepID=A0A2D0AI84_9FLAO|nr:hypothetical protein [Flavobacterium davisii]OWP82741.1 hypothetical protein BWK59_14255 [Flavobacterium davisii]